MAIEIKSSVSAQWFQQPAAVGRVRGEQRKAKFSAGTKAETRECGFGFLFWQAQLKQIHDETKDAGQDWHRHETTTSQQNYFSVAE